MHITVIVLNWKRPHNTMLILSSLVSLPAYVARILVGDNSRTLRPEDCRHDKVEVIAPSTNQGVLLRYSLASLSKTECLLIQDDDVLLPTETIQMLYNHWVKEPTLIHGLYGRKPKADGTYADFRDHDNERVEMICGRVMMFSRSLLPYFWFTWFNPAVQTVRQMAAALNSATHADDIVLSYTAMQRSGERNFVHDFSRTELPAPDAINALPEHWKIREDMMKTCRELCVIPEYAC